MRYESKKTPRGNIGISYVDQQSADAQAEALDAAGCTDCRYCAGCTDCTGCRYCTDCRYCAGCTDCTDCRYCTGCTGCTDCRYCTGCTGCTHCAGCTGCTHCAGVLIWRGPPASKLLALDGLTWPVATDGYYVQIGCQSHPIEAWWKFNDAEISAMAPQALEFWRTYKPLVLAMAELRRGLTP